MPERLPSLSVLLPVHNGGALLEDAVRSVLQQTFGDFELLLIDDGSTDDAVARVEAMRDARVRVLRQPRNLGLVAALNRGLDEARGALVARMDADDLCRPTRFARQVEFLERHPEVALCGTAIEAFGAIRREARFFPADPTEIRTALFFFSPLAHPSVVFRREAFARHALRYRSEFPGVEDWDLWTRAIRHLEFANLPEVLLDYRVVQGSASNANRQARHEVHCAIDRANLASLGITEGIPTELHRTLCEGAALSWDELQRPLREWMEKLSTSNQKSGTYPNALFRQRLGERYFQVGYHSAHEGFRVLRECRKHLGATPFRASLKQWIKFFARCALGHRTVHPDDRPNEMR